MSTDPLIESDIFKRYLVSKAVDSAALANRSDSPVAWLAALVAQAQVAHLEGATSLSGKVIARAAQAIDRDSLACSYIEALLAYSTNLKAKDDLSAVRDVLQYVAISGTSSACSEVSYEVRHRQPDNSFSAWIAAADDLPPMPTHDNQVRITLTIMAPDALAFDTAVPALQANTPARVAQYVAGQPVKLVPSQDGDQKPRTGKVVSVSEKHAVARSDAKRR